MRWKRIIQTIDVHCGGEIGRVVTGGILNIPGMRIADKLAHINAKEDALRQLLCSEPRSGPAGSIVLLLPSTRADADVGFIVLQADQAHAMSGSNAMCAVTAILETGMKDMTVPQTIVTLDTAAGLVVATAECRDGKVICVELDMPPAYVAQKKAIISTKEWGDITYDLCFGGVFYALVDVHQLGLEIEPENARKLATSGVTLRQYIHSETDIVHPLIPQIRGVAYVMFREAESEGVWRQCTTLKPARVDRSPCGTGSNAHVAVRFLEGHLEIGDTLTTRSIIGSEFQVKLKAHTQVGSYDAVQVRISGQCWIYGMTQIALDPTDPFQEGFRLSDTWG